jgi:hypothetical protein
MNSLEAICKEAQTELLTQLSVGEHHPNRVERYSVAINICNQFVEQQRRLISNHIFESKEDEVWFFKFVIPFFVSKYILYNELYRLFTYWPEGCKKAQQEYVKALLNRIHRFFKQHKDFHAYYITGKTDLDEYYFMRSRYDPLCNFDPADAINDPGLCTNGSHKLAVLLAYIELEQYILKHKLLEGGENIEHEQEVLLPWADSHSDYFQFIKSMEIKGSFKKNGKKVTVKEIDAVLSKVFGIKVDLRGAARNWRNKKGEKSDYLGDLKDGLDNAPDDDE